MVFGLIACLSSKLILIHTNFVNLLSKTTKKKLMQFSCFELVKLLIKLIDEMIDENIAHIRLAYRPAFYDEK